MTNYNLAEFKTWFKRRLGEQAFSDREETFTTIENLGGLENFLSSSSCHLLFSPLVRRWMAEVDERERELRRKT